MTFPSEAPWVVVHLRAPDRDDALRVVASLGSLVRDGWEVRAATDPAPLQCSECGSPLVSDETLGWVCHHADDEQIADGP